MSDEVDMMMRVDGWSRFSWLRHGFSTRFGGVTSVYSKTRAACDLNLGWTRDDDTAHVAENRHRLVSAVSQSATEMLSLVTLRQVHSAVSLVVPDLPTGSISDFADAEGRALLEGDGLMTSAKGVLLGIQTADCVPVFVVDTRFRVVANFHAGWRGTAARIVELGVAKMTTEFGSRPEDLIAAVGPSIGSCCYSVGDEVHQAFTSRFAYGEALFRCGTTAALSLYLDLWEANRRQLLDSGLAAERIAVLEQCTGCAGLPGRRRYFSHRCEHGFTGRMMNVVGVV